MIPAQDALEHQCFLDSIASHALFHPMPSPEWWVNTQNGFVPSDLVALQRGARTKRAGSTGLPKGLLMFNSEGGKSSIYGDECAVDVVGFVDGQPERRTGDLDRLTVGNGNVSGRHAQSLHAFLVVLAT